MGSLLYQFSCPVKFTSNERNALQCYTKIDLPNSEMNIDLNCLTGITLSVISESESLIYRSAE